MAKKKKSIGTAGSISKASSFKKWSKDVGQLRSAETPKKSKKKKYPKTKRGSTATEQKIEYLVSLKKEQEIAEKGWKVVRTKTYLELPKKAIGKEGYPYAMLNKNNHYESFYTWKEGTSKKRKR